jgi:hypothetical protein
VVVMSVYLIGKDGEAHEISGVIHGAGFTGASFVDNPERFELAGTVHEGTYLFGLTFQGKSAEQLRQMLFGRAPRYTTDHTGRIRRTPGMKPIIRKGLRS